MGVKANTGNLNLFITPFYRMLSNVPNGQTLQIEGQSFYSQLTVHNKYRTLRIEIEANFMFAKHVIVRGVLTFYKSEAPDFETCLANDFGKQDDSIVSVSCNEKDNIARSIISIRTAYNLNKFNA